MDDIVFVSSSFLQRERQVQKEETHELTEKLDQEWKSIQSLLAHKNPCKGGPTPADRHEEKPKVL